VGTGRSRPRVGIGLRRIPTPALAINDVFAPFFGLYASMGAHETHLARVMKLTGQTTVVDPNPYVSRMGGANGVDYAAIVLCPGKIDSGGRMIDESFVETPDPRPS
jgi:hypothetical protein